MLKSLHTPEGLLLMGETTLLIQSKAFIRALKTPTLWWIQCAQINRIKYLYHLLNIILKCSRGTWKEMKQNTTNPQEIGNRLQGQPSLIHYFNSISKFRSCPWIKPSNTYIFFKVTLQMKIHKSAPSTQPNTDEDPRPSSTRGLISDALGGHCHHQGKVLAPAQLCKQVCDGRQWTIYMSKGWRALSSCWQIVQELGSGRWWPRGERNQGTE